MRKVIAILIFNMIGLAIAAQRNGGVSGLAYDSAAQQPVAMATVTILDKKDSSLVTFTMTGPDGKFDLKGIANGEYRLLITHVNYHNSNSLFTISDAKKKAELGNITMTDLSKMLTEAVVRNEAPPITMIADTIQYNAGSFKTAPNASVEQLLKKLPGVKVEKDGSIKAQGEKVQRVLVDGKEFFGNDPKVATKNLPADAVDKVQVYDKQSDQAQLTGFDDGNYEKTINLKLKKDKKKGAFGKVNAGGGTNDRFEGKFNVNSFKGARQLSAIGMGNNDNAEGFSFMDILNFTGAMSKMQQGGGNVNISVTSDDPMAVMMGGGRNSGITTAWGGGLNYNDIIGTKLDLQSNYFYSRYNPYSETHTRRQYFLPDSSYYYTQDGNSDNLNNTHRVNLNMLFQLDSFNTLRVVPSFSYQDSRTRSRSDYQTRGGSGILANDGFSDNTGNNHGYNFSNDLIWRKKFRKRGRTFSLALQNGLNQSDGDGSLYSVNHFYNNGVLSQIDSIDQIYTSSGDLKSYNLRGVYTEPIGKRSLLEFSLGHSNSKSTADKFTYDFNRITGKHEVLNPYLSNQFENSYGYTNGGIRWRYQKRKVSMALGMAWQQSDLEGTIKSGIKDSVISKTFRNVLPNARFQYNFTKFKSLQLNYSTSVNQPTMSQLQPVPDNSNPLNIREGNPYLKQEYNHAVMAHLNLMNPYKNRSLFAFINAQLTQNKIVNYDVVDYQGRKTTKPVNVNGVFNMNSDISYSMPVRALKATLEVRAGNSYYSGKQFINTQVNGIRQWTMGPEVRLDITPNDKISFGLNASVDQTRTKYTIQQKLNTKYLSQVYGTSIDWEMPKKFYFSTEFNYTINSQRAGGFNNKLPIWDASISRQVLKFNRGELKFSARDLLNKNIGISRTSNQNYIEDARVLTLRRFFLLSFTYSLSKTGLNNAGGGGGAMRVITR